MIEIFGANTFRVVRFISQIPELGADDMDVVATAWRSTSVEERAAAWISVQNATKPEHRDAVRNAAAVARRQALRAALARDLHDWAFWSAAADAAGALAADALQPHDGSYRLLVSAMATRLQWLLHEPPGDAVSTLRETPLGAKSRR
jgi:hypothetical protein